MWTPDVYEGAPTSITNYFAIVPKVGISLVNKIYVYSIFQYIDRMADNFNFYFNCFYDFGSCCSNSSKILRPLGIVL